MTHTAYAHIQALLSDMSLLTEVYAHRGEEDALEEIATVVDAWVRHFRMKYYLPRDPRLYGVAQGRIAMPESGARCPRCNEVLVTYVDQTLRCLYCDCVYQSVTWLVLKSQPPSAERRRES